MRHLNPGGGWVSNLCHEPKVSARLLEYWLGPSITVLRRSVPIRIEVDKDRIIGVVIRCNLTGNETEIEPRFVLDASELGDGLFLSNAEFVTGFESRADTGEALAPESSQPDNWQAVTWVFAMAHDAGSTRVIDRPETYNRWRSFRPQFWPGPLLGPVDVHPITLQPRQMPLFSNDRLDWFRYRQIVDPNISVNEPHPVTVVNWPMNDYFDQPLIKPDGSRNESAWHDAKELSRCLLYYLQTEWPKPDGGTGYPGLYMHGASMGTDDGFAKFPYIRESRRAKTVRTVVAEDVATDANPGRVLMASDPKSIGIGAYRIDLHPSTGGDNYLDISSLPFEIPLGCLIPIRVKNLIPCAKNIGTTHITNGCYRMHPVEWNIGEAAGYLARFCLENDLDPISVWESGSPEFFALIEAEGVERHWPVMAPL
jgi:hypothetical protein